MIKGFSIQIFKKTKKFYKELFCINDKLVCSQPITKKWYNNNCYPPFYRSTPDAHTTADVDYRWKGGKSQGVEIVSKEMAQFDFVGAKTTTKANTNSKGMTKQMEKMRSVSSSRSAGSGRKKRGGRVGSGKERGAVLPASPLFSLPDPTRRTTSIAATFFFFWLTENLKQTKKSLSWNLSGKSFLAQLKLTSQ